MLTIKENQDLKVFTHKEDQIIKNILIKGDKAIATDTFSLIIYPLAGETDEPYLLSTETNQKSTEEAENYRNCERIIPTDEADETITLDNDYLLKCLRLVKKYAGSNAHIKLELRGENQAIVIKATHKKLEKEIKFLIMPIRTQ